MKYKRLKFTLYSTKKSPAGYLAKMHGHYLSVRRVYSTKLIMLKKNSNACIVMQSWIVLCTQFSAIHTLRVRVQRTYCGKKFSQTFVQLVSKFSTVVQRCLRPYNVYSRYFIVDLNLFRFKDLSRNNKYSLVIRSSRI